jgi:hypothetical protein
MVYGYALKGGRKYPYYLCRNAQQKGWAVCPSKSLPAQAIEESVVRRIRETQGGIADAPEWEQMDRSIQLETIQTIVERVGYDGTSRQVSIRFHSTAVATTGEETRA